MPERRRVGSGIGWEIGKRRDRSEYGTGGQGSALADVHQHVLGACDLNFEPLPDAFMTFVMNAHRAERVRNR